MNDYILGQILLLAFKWSPPPLNSVACDGSTYNISQYQALYSLIGNVYGGNQAAGTFAVPNLKGAEPLPGTQYVIITNGYYPERP